MATRLYIDNEISDSQLCELLDIPVSIIESYQALQDLEKTISIVTDHALKQSLGYQLYVLKTSIPELSRFCNYKLYGFGRVEVATPLGRTDEPTQIAYFLNQVDRGDLIGKVTALCWG